MHSDYKFTRQQLNISYVGQILKLLEYILQICLPELMHFLLTELKYEAIDAVLKKPFDHFLVTNVFQNKSFNTAKDRALFDDVTLRYRSSVDFFKTKMAVSKTKF